MSMDFPIKNKKRADRRKEKIDKFRHAKEVADHLFSKWPEGEKWKTNWAKRHTDNLKACSCWMCCNPRRIGEITIQEKKFKEAIKCEDID